MRLGDAARNRLRLWAGGPLSAAAAIAVAAVAVLPARAQPAPGCRASQIAVSGRWQGATMNLAGEFTFTNTSSHACYLAGELRAVVVNQSGDVLPIPTNNFGTPVSIGGVLQPGDSAGVRFVQAYNYCGPRPAGPPGVAITLPDDGGSVLLPKGPELHACADPSEQNGNLAIGSWEFAPADVLDRCHAADLQARLFVSPPRGVPQGSKDQLVLTNTSGRSCAVLDSVHIALVDTVTGAVQGGEASSPMPGYSQIQAVLSPGQSAGATLNLPWCTVAHQGPLALRLFFPADDGYAEAAIGDWPPSPADRPTLPAAPCTTVHALTPLLSPAGFIAARSVMPAAGSGGLHSPHEPLLPLLAALLFAAAGLMLAGLARRTEAR